MIKMILKVGQSILDWVVLSIYELVCFALKCACVGIFLVIAYFSIFGGENEEANQCVSDIFTNIYRLIVYSFYETGTPVPEIIEKLTWFAMN